LTFEHSDFPSTDDLKLITVNDNRRVFIDAYSEKFGVTSLRPVIDRFLRVEQKNGCSPI